jgi:nitronate monooxygenase/enoyl-[acyl-carrier protein] reductase II
MGSFTSAELVAAVTNAGGLGSLGAANRPLEDFRRHLARIGDLTAGSFAVNHAITVIDEEAFQAGLDAHPKVVTLALDHPHDYVARVHDAGALAMHQVTTVQQAVEAAERGVDIIIAQGGESGGYGGVVSTMPLVPQVVDAVQPVPVIAAGGITDGRGLAAALMLGAQGVNSARDFSRRRSRRSSMRGSRRSSPPQRRTP